MIGLLRGAVAHVETDSLILDVNGVGYRVHCGGKTLAQLMPGDSAVLAIETIVREDMIKLIGFRSEAERAWFDRLVSIQGVGPSHALAVLDVLEPGQLMEAAALGDQAAVSRAKGVGKKLAERIVLELKGKAPPLSASDKSAYTAGAADPGAAQRPEAAAGATERSEAVSALVNLGYDQAAALRAVAAAARASDKPDTSALIKGALRELAA